MISNQLSAVVISCVCLQSGGGTTGTQKGKVDGNIATRSFYCCSNKRQLVFNFHMQLSKMLAYLQILLQENSLYWERE